MQYSCAYFAAEGVSLEEAQEAKKRHIAAKLDIRPGHRVLDIGCGFGGTALFLARNYGVHVTGITLSTEQHKIARERAARLGLTRLVDFRLEDYRGVHGVFDRIVSIGMFEHVGRPHGTSSRASTRSSSMMASAPAPHRRSASSTSSIPEQFRRRRPARWRRRQRAVMDSFPPPLPEARKQHAPPLNEWSRRFQASRERVRALNPAIYDERFFRMWEYYLQACELGFRYSGLTVFQLQLARRIDTLPITRDYMLAEERRRTSGAAGGGSRAAGG